MKIKAQAVVFDAADLAAESSFWVGVMDGTLDIDDDWHMVMVDGQPRIGVQRAPNHVPPDWPGGAPQQIHVDSGWTIRPRRTTSSCHSGPGC